MTSPCSKGGVRAKYHRQALAGRNLVSIEPELERVFRDAEPVNRALRLLVDAAEAAVRPARRWPGARRDCRLLPAVCFRSSRYSQSSRRLATAKPSDRPAAGSSTCQLERLSDFRPSLAVGTGIR